MKQQILDKVEECFKTAEKFYGHSFPRPKNIVFRRHGTIGGWSWHEKSELMFQLDFAENYPENYINQIVPHEVAHWVDVEQYGKSKTTSGRRIHHGHTWKYIMQYVYGLNPDRCHDYSRSVTKTKQYKNFIYKCSCQEHEVSTILHNKIQRGKPYRCKSCGCRLTYSPVSSIEIQIEKLKKQIEQLQQTQS